VGFHEDDRIRRKNTDQANKGTINSDIRLNINNIPINEVINLLINNGYKVEIKSDSIITISRNPSNGKEDHHFNPITGNL